MSEQLPSKVVKYDKKLYRLPVFYRMIYLHLQSPSIVCKSLSGGSKMHSEEDIHRGIIKATDLLTARPVDPSWWMAYYKVPDINTKTLEKYIKAIVVRNFSSIKNIWEVTMSEIAQLSDEKLTYLVLPQYKDTLLRAIKEAGEVQKMATPKPIDISDLAIRKIKGRGKNRTVETMAEDSGTFTMEDADFED